MNKKSQKRTVETRHKILATARDLVNEFGFDGVSTDEITRRSGVAKGTLFAHFGDKNGLMSCLLEERLAAMLDDWREANAATKIGVETLLDRAMMFVSLMSSERAVFGLFLENAGITSSNTTPQFYQTLARLTDLLAAHLQDWASTKKTTDMLRTDLSPAELGQGLIAFMIQAASRHLCGEIPVVEDVKAMLEKQFRAWLLIPMAAKN